jgi:hypothetical protein
VGGVDLVGTRLVINPERPADTAEAVAFEVELERGLLGLVAITERVRARRVLAAAPLALEALAPRSVEA